MSIAATGPTTSLSLAEVRDWAATGRARDIRLRARLTRVDVANSLGVDPGTVYRWETAARRPRGAAALRYHALLSSLDRMAAA